MSILLLYLSANGRHSGAGEIKVDNTACKKLEKLLYRGTEITGIYFYAFGS